MQYTEEYLKKHSLLLKILIAYDYTVIDTIRTRNNDEYGNATREEAIEQGLSIDIIGNTLYITIDLSKVT
jgi:hypothetical protein